MASKEELRSILGQVGGFECVEENEEPNQLRLVGRVQQRLSSNWVLVLHQMLLQAEKSQSWYLDISRLYFLRNLPTGKKLFFAWRIILQAEDISLAIDEVITAVKNAPKPNTVEVEEFPLPGVVGDRNRPGRSGGYAGNVFSTPVGPAAVRR